MRSKVPIFLPPTRPTTGNATAGPCYKPSFLWIVRQDFIVDSVAALYCLGWESQFRTGSFEFCIMLIVAINMQCALLVIRHGEVEVGLQESAGTRPTGLPGILTNFVVLCWMNFGQAQQIIWSFWGAQGGRPGDKEEAKPTGSWECMHYISFRNCTALTFLVGSRPANFIPTCGVGIRRRFYLRWVRPTIRPIVTPTLRPTNQCNVRRQIKFSKKLLIIIRQKSCLFCYGCAYFELTMLLVV